MIVVVAVSMPGDATSRRSPQPGVTGYHLAVEHGENPSGSSAHRRHAPAMASSSAASESS